MPGLLIMQKWLARHDFVRRVLRALSILVLGLTVHLAITSAPSSPLWPHSHPHKPQSKVAVVTVPSTPRPLPTLLRVPQPPAPPPRPQGHLYQIQWGDSLWAIARRFHVSIKELQIANGLHSDKIQAGQFLVVPQIYTVTSGNTWTTIAEHFNVSRTLLKKENGLNSARLYPGQRLVIPYIGRIPKPQYPAPPPSDPDTRLVSRGQPVLTAYSPQDMLLLARLVQAEAGNQPFIGQVAVAAVVVNRLHTRGYPKSLSAVIAEPGQFDTVSSGKFWTQPRPLAMMAAQAALRGWDPTHGALYYFNPNLPHNQWMNTLPETAVIADQVFCR